MASRGEGWVVAQALLLGAVVVAGLAAPAWLAMLPWLGIPVGALLVALGGMLALAGVRGLGRGRGLSPFPRPPEGAQLVETGVYARARHPIYGGLVLIALGWGFLTASIVAIVLALALLPFFLLKARREEELLVERFPAYEEYRRRTPRRLFPWLL